MENTKEMCRTIPIGSCPACGHNQFIVDEISHDRYLTNRDGDIIDSAEVSYNAIGYCLNCSRQYPMIPIRFGFIPASKLRSILYEFTPHSSLVVPDFLKDENSKSPMEG